MSAIVTRTPTRMDANLAAAVLGQVRYITARDARMRVLGLLKPRPLTIHGKLIALIKRAMAGVYPEHTGRSITLTDHPYNHPELEFLTSRPHAICDHEERCVDFEIAGWGDEWGPASDDIPEHIRTRLYVNMACTGMGMADAFVLRRMDELILHTEERDEVWEAQKLPELRAWWDSRIVRGDEEPISFSADAVRWLKQTYPENTLPVRAAEPTEADLLDAYAYIREQAANYTAQKQQLEMVLKERIADSSGLEWERGKLTYKRMKDTRRVDWQALAKELMQGMTIKDRANATNRHTTIVQGERRIHFTPRGASLLALEATQEGDANDSNN